MSTEEYRKQKRQERIEQIKKCGQHIIDNAEKIYGDCVFPTNLEIVVKIDTQCKLPIFSVKRESIPELLIDFDIQYIDVTKK